MVQLVADAFSVAMIRRSVDEWNSFVESFEGPGDGATIANLSRADLSNCDLRGAKFSRVDICFTCFAGCDLTGADFSCAPMSCTILRCTNLSGANFADMKAGYLLMTDFCGADLRTAVLGDADFSQTMWDEHTQWPDGFVPPPSFDAANFQLTPLHVSPSLRPVTASAPPTRSFSWRDRCRKDDGSRRPSPWRPA